MSEVSLQSLADQTFDVVICGGGLAGLTLARQLRRNLPSLSVLVAERTQGPLPEATHKVGESSVELGSRYLEELGLREYLEENHLFKFGLRFFIGDGQRPIEERSEIGPAYEPIVPSYQLDRGRLENDLRKMIVEDGATLMEGTKVCAIDLQTADAPHEIELQDLDGPSGRVRIRSRWIVDASGRAALLRKRLKLSREMRHDGNASWFRVKGKVDLTELVSDEAKAWHETSSAEHRWRSTNHFMGPGYWAWIIPLSSGNTSIGIVTHNTHHGFDRVRNLTNSLAFLDEFEPVVAKALAPYEVLDFGSLRNYSHDAERCWSSDRWALVGEAGAFVDPLYSPGTDFIAYGNSFTEEMIRADLSGQDLDARASELSSLYASVIGSCVDLYRHSADVYGHFEAFHAKCYWDNFAYWSYPCQLFMQGLYRQSGDELAEVVAIGDRFAELTGAMQKFFAAWALLGPSRAKPGFVPIFGLPSVLIDAHVDLQNEWTPSETLEYMRMRLAQGEEIVGELVLRGMDAVGSENAEELIERAGVRDWGIQIADDRVAATEKVGLARRRATTPLARDVERTLRRPAERIAETTVRQALGPVVQASL